MAGIGFELRKLLRRDSYFGLLRAYGYAGVISSGPWILSIVGVLAIGLFSATRVVPDTLVVQFLVTVTWIMAGSLILTGLLQLLFTRYIADRLFEKRDRVVLPNLMGALTLVTLVAGGLGALLLHVAFDASALYEFATLGSFVVLCNIWILVIFLSGMKAYRLILGVFLLGYGVTVGAAMALTALKLEGLMLGFFIGQSVLLFATLALVVRHYPGEDFVAYDFLRRSQAHYSLAITGLLYNSGIWADKFMFWMNPATSDAVIGPLRASVIYDIPIFLAYLSIIPGMAVFLVRMETDFAEIYDRFYRSVREGDTLDHILGYKRQMVLTIRQGVFEIFKVQGLTIVVLLMAGPALLDALGISHLYLPLFNVDLIGVGIQVLLLAILNVLFYLDLLGFALFLCLIFLTANLGFTWITLQLGPQFYGFGFAAAVTLAALVGLAILSRQLRRLEYETFMLQ